MFQVPDSFGQKDTRSSVEEEVLTLMVDKMTEEAKVQPVALFPRSGALEAVEVSEVAAAVSGIEKAVIEEAAVVSEVAVAASEVAVAGLGTEKVVIEEVAVVSEVAVAGLEIEKVVNEEAVVVSEVAAGISGVVIGEAAEISGVVIEEAVAGSEAVEEAVVGSEAIEVEAAATKNFGINLRGVIHISGDTIHILGDISYSTIMKYD